MDTIRIGENYYNAETLTDAAKALLSDIQKVDSRLNQLSLDASIMDLAKQTLIGKLVEETVNLQQVPGPTAQAAANPPAPVAEG